MDIFGIILLFSLVAAIVVVGIAEGFRQQYIAGQRKVKRRKIKHVRVYSNGTIVIHGRFNRKTVLEQNEGPEE
jgi:hypothetical protein